MNFTNGAELLEYCEKEKKTISEAMFERETTFLEQDPEKTKEKMKKAWSIMQASAKKPLKENIVSMGGMIGGESRKLHTLRENGKNICGDVVSKAIAYAVGVLEVNASMGLIVAAPTAGSSGVIPGVFCSLQENFGFTDEEICKVLFNAAAVGYLITRNATTAGAEGGCQAEVGAASAMAASAAVELLGGTPAQCLDAASFAIVNILGLVCDPIGGLVENPCQNRNSPWPGSGASPRSMRRSESCMRSDVRSRRSFARHPSAGWQSRRAHVRRARRVQKRRDKRRQRTGDNRFQIRYRLFFY